MGSPAALPGICVWTGDFSAPPLQTLFVERNSCVEVLKFMRSSHCVVQLGCFPHWCEQMNGVRDCPGSCRAKQRGVGPPVSAAGQVAGLQAAFPGSAWLSLPQASGMSHTAAEEKIISKRTLCHFLGEGRGSIYRIPRPSA